MAWFDASVIDPATAPSSFPVGNHPVVIRSSARVPVKDKPNEGRLVFKCEIIDGPNKGSFGDYGLNLWNGNPQASEIAGRQLSALCHVIGRYQLNDAVNMGSELFNMPFRIIVGLQKGENPNCYTEVQGVTDMAGQAPTKGQAPASAQPMQNPAPQQQPPQPQPSQPSQGAPAWQGGAPTQQPAPGGAAPAWGAPAAQPAPAASPAPTWAQQPPGGAPAWQR
jgi:hypothetical protein